METKKILKWPLIIGIVVILNMFFLYAVKVVYPEPTYDDFCKEKPVVKQIDNQEGCLVEGGQWIEKIDKFESTPLYEDEMMAVKTSAGFCDQQFTCRQDFDTAREDYERNVFMAVIIFGVLAVIGSFLTIGEEVVSIALSLGGVLAFIIASTRYWRYASDWLHLAILGVALSVLIWLAIKKFTE